MSHNPNSLPNGFYTTQDLLKDYHSGVQCQHPGCREELIPSCVHVYGDGEPQYGKLVCALSRHDGQLVFGHKKVKMKPKSIYTYILPAGLLASSALVGISVHNQNTLAAFGWGVACVNWIGVIAWHRNHGNI